MMLIPSLRFIGTVVGINTSGEIISGVFYASMLMENF